MGKSYIFTVMGNNKTIHAKEDFMMEEKNKQCCGDVIKGIHCDVRNCVYNEKGCYCHADSISVGPSNATRGSETVCVTFKPKAE